MIVLEISGVGGFLREALRQAQCDSPALVLCVRDSSEKPFAAWLLCDGQKLAANSPALCGELKERLGQEYDLPIKRPAKGLAIK